MPRRDDYQDRNAIDELVKLLEAKSIKDIDFGNLVKPDGYAPKVARMGVKTSQVRKIYTEFRNVCEKIKNSPDESAMVKLYMLYPLTEYQKERRIIPEEFAKVITALLSNIERDHSPENVERAEKFFMAIVAYAKKE